MNNLLMLFIFVPILALVAIIVSVISASYYLKIIRVLHTDTLDSNEVVEVSNNNLLLENRNEQSLNNNDNTGTLLTNFHSFLISSLTLSILLFILKPSLILNSTQLLSLSLFNF